MHKIKISYICFIIFVASLLERLFVNMYYKKIVFKKTFMIDMFFV